MTISSLMDNPLELIFAFVDKMFQLVNVVKNFLFMEMNLTETLDKLADGNIFNKIVFAPIGALVKLFPVSDLTFSVWQLLGGVGLTTFLVIIIVKIVIS